MPQAPFAALLSPSVSTIESAPPASETAEADLEAMGSPDLTLEHQEPDPGVDVGPVEGAQPDTDPDLAADDAEETS